MLLRATAGLLAAALVVPVFADPPTVPVRAPVPERAAEKPDLAKQLAARVTLDKGFEGSFKEGVTMIASAYDLPLVIDRRFSAAGQMAFAHEQDMVKLPKLTNVKLSTVLDLLAEQVNGNALVYPDHIKLVPAAHWLYETGVHSHDPTGADELVLLPAEQLLLAKPLPQRAPVNLTFRAKPLNEALDEIADATGANVVLSPAVPAAVRTTSVTARFANAPVATAVRTLCELTDTGVIEDGNVLVVTTREKAAARAKADQQKRNELQHPRQGPVFGYGSNSFAGVQNNLGGGQLGFGGQPAGFGGNPNPAPAAGMMGMGMGQPNPVPPDVLKLKEQNEQLRKELEDLKKALKK